MHGIPGTDRRSADHCIKPYLSQVSSRSNTTPESNGTMAIAMHSVAVVMNRRVFVNGHACLCCNPICTVAAGCAYDISHGRPVQRRCLASRHRLAVIHAERRPVADKELVGGGFRLFARVSGHCLREYDKKARPTCRSVVAGRQTRCPRCSGYPPPIVGLSGGRRLPVGHS